MLIYEVRSEKNSIGSQMTFEWFLVRKNAQEFVDWHDDIFNPRNCKMKIHEVHYPKENCPVPYEEREE